MSRFVKNILAIFRGGIYSLKSKIFSNATIKCNCFLVKFKGVDLRTSKNAYLVIGKRVKLGEDSLISTLNGGKLVIENNVSIGRWNAIVCHNSIYIGEGTILAPNVLIYDHDHVFNEVDGVEKNIFTTRPISIGKNCWIGANVVILKGTKIGNRCVIGAGSVLKGIYPDDSLIIQSRKTEIIPIKERGK